MLQLDEILGDSGTPETLSPEQVIERWKPCWTVSIACSETLRKRKHLPRAGRCIHIKPLPDPKCPPIGNLSPACRGTVDRLRTSGPSPTQGPDEHQGRSLDDEIATVFASDRRVL